MGLMHNEKGLIATPLRAFVALALTGLFAAQNVYPLIAAKNSVKDLATFGIHPHWPVVSGIVACDLVVAVSLLVFAASNPLRNEERIFWLAVAVNQMSFPATLLFPKAIRLLELVHTGSLLIAFLTAAMLFKAICEGQEDKELH